MLSNSLESAQKRVEGNNFDIRKTLLEYDNVLNEQRTIIYKKRNEILELESIHDNVLDTINNYVYDIIPKNTYILVEKKEQIICIKAPCNPIKVKSYKKY